MVHFGLEVLLPHLAADDLTPTQLVELLYDRMAKWDTRGVWIHIVSKEAALRRASELEVAFGTARGRRPPLYGIPFAVKDNIDIAGLPTTAACPAFTYIPKKSAPAVDRLLAAGAILIGKTNMDQFATGLTGTRSPYGVCPNSTNPRYISGGSSSGSAVAVARGWVSFALGTDTAGSGRVPAAFNNIVGFKPTRDVISTEGVVPACRSLDCVSIFAHNVNEVSYVYDILAGRNGGGGTRQKSISLLPTTPGSRWRLGILPREQMEFFGDGDSERLYLAAIGHLQRLGGQPVEINHAPFREAGLLLYGGPWVRERLEAAGTLLDANPKALHPVTRQILEKARRFKAADLGPAKKTLARLSRQAALEWKRMDVLVLPTTPTIYRITEVERDPITLNSRLGIYTNFMNLMDLCGLALPAGFASDGLPRGITLVGRRLHDGRILDLGARYQRPWADPRSWALLT